jgi:hypothetical protein
MMTAPSYTAWGAATYMLLRNIPTGYFAWNYFDKC